MAQRKLSEESKIIDRGIGERLRAMRIARKMSQTDLGDLLGVTFQQIQKYERGANRIGSSRLHNLCEIFETEPNSFFDPELSKGAGAPTDELVKSLQRKNVVTLIRAVEALDGEAISALTACARAIAREA